MALTSNLRPLRNRIHLNEFVTPHTYLIDQLYPGLEGPTKKETAYSCLDWVCRNIKYQTERGGVWLYLARPSSKARPTIGSKPLHLLESQHSGMGEATGGQLS